MLTLCPAFLGLSVQTDLASLLGGKGQAAGQVQSLRCVATDLQRAPPSFANLVLGKTRTSGLLDCPNEDKQAALRAAAARMEAVTGIPPAAVEELWRGENVGPRPCVGRGDRDARKEVLREAIMAWAGVERGSDLFIAGRFNIASVHEDLLGGIMNRAQHALGRSPSLQEVLFRPSDLQAAAYFPNVFKQTSASFGISPASSSGNFRRLSRILGHEDGASYPPRQHILRYRAWWDNADRINQLDELEDASAAHDRAVRAVAEFRRDRRERFLWQQSYRQTTVRVADGVDVWRLISDEDAPIPDVSVVSTNPILDYIHLPLKGQKGGGLAADPRGLGPKTKEALELYGGVATIADLAALTTAQQEALLASVPRTISSQLARKGGLAAIVQRAKEHEEEGKAEQDRAEKKRGKEMREILGKAEKAFKQHVARERQEYARLLGVEEQLAAMWRNDRVALRPEVLLGRLRRQREDAELAKVENVEFTYLNASLSDGPVGPDGLQLRVLRSSRRVWQVGKKLRNCAIAYSSRCAEGKYVLVALVHAANATPVALGGYVVGRSGQWEQVVGMANRRPDDATRLRFREYLPTLDAFFAERTAQLRREQEEFLEQERLKRRRTLDRLLEEQGLSKDKQGSPPAAGAEALPSRHASLAELRVAFTGTLGLTRREAVDLAEAAGAIVPIEGLRSWPRRPVTTLPCMRLLPVEVPNRPSARCDVLVAGVRPGGQKVEAAQKAGAEVWTEAEFIAMARQAAAS